MIITVFVKDCGILDDFVSDHYTVYCIYKKKKEQCTMTTRTVRDYSAFDKNNFENLLVNFDWTAFDVSNNPEVQWESMIQYIRNTLSIMCPFKKVNSCKTVTPGSLLKYIS